MSATLDDLYDQYGLVDLKEVSRVTGEPIQRLAKMTPVSASALRQNPKSPKAQESARRFVRILGKLVRLLGSSKSAMIWMREPHPELEGMSPMSALEEGLFQSVEGLVHDLATGSPG